MNTIDKQYQPADWASFVGQRTMKERLDLAIRSALSRDARLDHILLDGPAGSGKSTMAHLLAQRMGQPMITAPMRPTTKELLHRLFEIELGGILFLDECHDLPAATETALLGLLEGATLHDYEFPYCTIVAATTEPEALKEPFIDRFVRPRFSSYDDQDMAKIVAGFADRAPVALPPAVCRKLGAAAAGVPRIARGFVIAARDIALDGHTPTVPAILRFCHRAEDGLSTEHVEYLRILNTNAGRAGLDVLCNHLRMHKSLVVKLERLLMDRGYIRLDSTGRLMTGTGRKRLQEAA